MGIRYRDQNGMEKILSGLTPGGNLERSAVLTRSGTVTIASIPANSQVNQTITFDNPFDGNIYDTEFIALDCNGLAITVRRKTESNMVISAMNTNSVNITNQPIQWRAYQILDAADYAQLISEVQTLNTMIPETASSTNKLSTKSDLQAVNRSLDMRLDDVEDVIPLTASVSNQLATQSQVEEAMANAGLKVTDTIPSTPQDGDVLLYIGNESGFRKGGIYQYAASPGAWVLISTAEVDLSHYETTFVGTTAEWEALTTAEKNGYTLVSLTDDQEALGVNAVDAVTDSDMHPITSNAVYDCFKGLFKIATASLTAYSGITAAGKYLVPLDFTVPTGYVPVAVVRWDFGRIKGLNIMGLLLGPTLTTVQMTCYADNALDTVLNGSVEVLCIKSEFKPS